MKIIISPHYDDGLLSCSSILEDNDILVTVFTKHDVNIYNKASNELKKYLNYPLREKENKLAGKFRNLKIINLGYREDYFRKCDNILKCKLKKDIIKIMNKYNVDTIYIPLGIGYHNDHILVFDILKDIKVKNKYFYYDYPYCSFNLATKTRLSDFGIIDGISKEDIIQFKTNTMYPSIVKYIRMIIYLLRYSFNRCYYNLFNKKYNYLKIKNKINRANKITSISLYKSQINPIFGSKNNMMKHVIEYSNEYMIVLEKNTNNQHKIKLLLNIIPYLLFYPLISNIYFTILFYILLILFYRNISSMKKNKLKLREKSIDIIIYYLVPCYNESKNIQRFIENLDINDRIKYIFIDDCSDDNSYSMINNYNRKDFILIKSKVKCDIVSQVLNIGYNYLKKNVKLNDNTYIGLLNVDSYLMKDGNNMVISILEKYDIDMINFRNKSINICNYVNMIANDEKEFKYMLSKNGNVNLNNGYLIKSTKHCGYIDSWTEDLVLGNIIKGIKYQSDIIIFDNVPDNLLKLIKQKMRWIRGDLMYRLSNIPSNIFDIIVNIYYIMPLYFITNMIFFNKFIFIDYLGIIILENILYYQFTGKFNLFYSLFQQFFNIVFYIDILLNKFKW